MDTNGLPILLQTATGEYNAVPMMRLGWADPQPYDAAKTFAKRDVVQFQGSTFLVVATGGITGIEPMDGADYKLLAARGEAGAGNASWFAGTAVDGEGTGIIAGVPGSKAGDMYLNSATSALYIATDADTWDFVMRLGDLVAVTAENVLTEDGDTVQEVLDDHDGRIVDVEARTAAEISTSEAGVSVQGALDAQGAELGALGEALDDQIDALNNQLTRIQTLEGQTAIEILTTTLLQDAWTQDENSGIFEQSISNALFAAEDYSYHMAVAPGDIFAAADLGGIVMASAADGSAIFQCRSQPEVDIAIQIERTPRKDGA